jgi:hypothetical protein
MRYAVLFLVAICIAATPRDLAVIVDSGSTNTLGYKIEVWSDGSGRLTLQNRAGVAQGAPKSFTLPAATTARFFSDLQAARKGNATSEPCAKSASFGTTTHVMWQGWTSPDLDCPPEVPLTSALVRDVADIRVASGVATLPMRRVPWTPATPTPR